MCNMLILSSFRKSSYLSVIQSFKEAILLLGDETKLKEAKGQERTLSCWDLSRSRADSKAHVHLAPHHLTWQGGPLCCKISSKQQDSTSRVGA